MFNLKISPNNNVISVHYCTSLAVTIPPTTEVRFIFVRMALPPEAVRPREEALALVQMLHGRKELADLQLHTIMTCREQFRLSRALLQ
jgi:hypothetical protein